MRLGLALLFAMGAICVGCGSDEADPEPPGNLSEVTIDAEGTDDRRVATDLRRYLVRNCPAPGDEPHVPEEQQGTKFAAVYEHLFRGTVVFCGGVASIKVEDRRVTVRSGLPAGADVDSAGEGFCNLIQGSDVADFTAGHELQDLEGETVKVCPARSG